MDKRETMKHETNKAKNLSTYKAFFAAAGMLTTIGRLIKENGYKI
jgi:hypothetical protein